MDPKTKSILLKCARTYFSLKSWEKAKAEYENLHADDPEDPHISESLGICYQNLGHFEKALQLLKLAEEKYNAHGHPEKIEHLAPRLQEISSHLQTKAA